MKLRHDHRGCDARVAFDRAAAILSSHRRVPPYGVAGGKPGAVGRNYVERADGGRVALSGIDKVEMGAGNPGLMRKQPHCRRRGCALRRVRARSQRVK